MTAATTAVQVAAVLLMIRARLTVGVRWAIEAQEKRS